MGANIVCVRQRNAFCSYLEVAALASGAGRVGQQHARGSVAARVVAAVLQAAVTLLARLHEAVAADGAVEQAVRKTTHRGISTDHRTWSFFSFRLVSCIRLQVQLNS
jgi:hypothetical protein